MFCVWQFPGIFIPNRNVKFLAKLNGLEKNSGNWISRIFMDYGNFPEFLFETAMSHF